MTDDRLNFGPEEQQRDATRLLPSKLLSSSESEAIAARVADVVHRHKPVHLLTGFAFPNLLLHPTDSYSVFIEYLHHLVLTLPPVSSPADADEDLINTLFADVKNLFGGAMFGPVHIPSDGEERSDLQKSVVLDSLYIRGKSYLVHQVDLLEGLFGSVDDWLRTNMGISTVDVTRTARWLFETLADRASAAGAAMQDVRAARAGGSLRALLEYDVFRLPSPDSGIRGVLRLLAATPGSKPQTSSLLPGRGWAVSRDFPILDTGDNLYCFNPQAVTDELPRLLGKWISVHDKAFFDRSYARKRERIIAEKTLVYLARVLPGAECHQNIYYGEDPANRTETDGLVLYDDVAIIIEAKAGTLSFPARRGYSDRLKRDFDELVDRAFGQASRTADFIRTHPHATFADGLGNPVVRLNGRTFRKTYLLSPVLDPMDPLAIGLANARASGLLATNPDWPWSVFINDLHVITDVLDSPSVFLLYMDRRLRFNVHSSWFHVHDELDLLDYFLRTGLFLEEKPIKDVDVVYWQADTTDLDRYYAALAMGRELPAKPRPPFLSEISTLVRSIEQTAVPNRMALATEILGLGEKSHRKILGILPQLPTRLAQRRVPQCGKFVREGVGVSFWFAENVHPQTRQHLLFEDRCNKYEHRADEWLSAIFVVKGGKPILDEVIRDATPWREDADMKAMVQTVRDTKFDMRRNTVSPGRNDPCPCGSGRKFKKCHGRQ